MDAESDPDPLEPAQIAQRYNDLALGMEPLLRDCRRSRLGSGEFEHLSCPRGRSTLELITYTNSGGKTGARNRTVTLAENSIYRRSESGTYYQVSNDQGATIVRDTPHALTSGRLSGSGAKSLTTLYDRIDTRVDAPQGPTDSDVRSWASYWGAGDCARRTTTEPGMTELNVCDNGKVFAYVAGSTGARAFTDYRKFWVGVSEDSRDPDAYHADWNYTGQKKTSGVHAAWGDEPDNQAWNYVDETSCHCFVISITEGTTDADQAARFLGFNDDD